jgi:hypothetical protein
MGLRPIGAGQAELYARVTERASRFRCVEVSEARPVTQLRVRGVKSAVMDLEGRSYMWDRTNHAYRLLQVPGSTEEEPDCFLIVDLWTDTIRCHEDDAFARALKSRMLAEGVPVLSQESWMARPLSPLHLLLNDVEAGRITWPDYNRRVRAVAHDANARRLWIQESGLDR